MIGMMSHLHPIHFKIVFIVKETNTGKTLGNQDVFSNTLVYLIEQKLIYHELLWLVSCLTYNCIFSLLPESFIELGKN